MNKEARLRKLARTLLATTCLTAAAGVASASSFTESSDLSNFSFSPTTLLAGTTTVNGTLCPDCADNADWFDIPGLAPGTTEKVVISGSPQGLAQIGDIVGDGFVAGFGPTQFNSEGGTITTTVTVPADGDLVFGITTVPQQTVNTSYTVNLTSATPEPGTFAAGALALAGAVALRRKRKQS